MFINNTSKKSIYLFILSTIRPFKVFIVGQFMVSIIMSINMSLRPYLIKVILDEITTILPLQAFDILILPTMLYILISVITIITLRFHGCIILKFHLNLKKHIGITLMNRMMDHSHSFFQNHFSGSIANKVNDVTNGIPNIISVFIDRFFTNVLGLLVAIYTVWFIDLKFAIALTIWIIVFLFVSIKLSAKSTILSNKAAEVRSTVIGHIVDILSNIVSVRLFVGKNFEISYLRKIYQRSVQAEQIRNLLFIKIHTLQESSFVIFQSICLWWLIIGIKDNTVTLGDFALILILNISIINCLHALSRDISEFARDIGNVTQGLNIIYSTIEIQDAIDARDLTVTKGEIIFENVQFYYNNPNNLILNNISVQIYSHQKVGLVGYSGSGKSTFVNLILRLHDTNGGRILIDNQDIKSIAQASLRKAVGIIPQELFLFNRTLMENIRYGQISTSDQKVIEAAKNAHINEFICNLSEGYNTLLGERGVKLSGGERQRIAIARAILKNAPVLILDEATSQLDSITEQLIQNSLLSLMQDKTTIVIAHRLSTLLNMDRILVFDKGKIVQDGTHTDLINQKGLYKKLWNTQVRGFLPKKSD